MDKDILLRLVKKLVVLSSISAMVIKLSGGKGWVGYTEYAFMVLLILYMNRKLIEKLIFEYVEE